MLFAIVAAVLAWFIQGMILQADHEPLLDDDDPTPSLNKNQRAALQAEIAAREAGRRTCSACGLATVLEAATCSRCGADLSDLNRTIILPPLAHIPTITGDIREALIYDQTAIVLTIGNNELKLPIAGSLTIGRGSAALDPIQPHVDLAPYRGWATGISRQHIEIRRKGMLVYVIDLGSTNGTSLNGRRVEPGTLRLLRNGDELYLSRLRILVKFESSEA